MREYVVENEFVKAVKAAGGVAYKLTSQTANGLPDRLVLFFPAKAVFVELKAPGKMMRPLQRKRRYQLMKLGFPVLCIDKLYQIKPCIEVNNSDGASMTVGRKYRGKFENVIIQYTREKLSQFSSFDTKRIALVSCDVPDDIVKSVYDIIDETGMFEEICVTKASCTITSHCGPCTLGVMFITK